MILCIVIIIIMNILYSVIVIIQWDNLMGGKWKYYVVWAALLKYFIKSCKTKISPSTSLLKA